MPKGRVMFVSNAIKVVGCLLMLFGAHPLLAYAVVGLGAAAYSPAKYGILTELLPPSQLVKANGWIEGLTIGSIVLGMLLGGQLIGARSSPACCWALDMPCFDTGIDTAPEAAICRHRARCTWWRPLFNLFIPRTGAPLQPWIASRCRTWCATSRSCNSRLWADKLGQISLATTTLLWGVFGQPAAHRAARGRLRPWATAPRRPPAWPAWWSSASAVGAVVASVVDEAGPRDAASSRWASRVGCSDDRPDVHRQRLGSAAPFLVRAGRDRRLPGGADERAAAAPRPQPDGRRAARSPCRTSTSRPASWAWAPSTPA
jgi:MFS family permease